jgi:hypothetical protein
MNRRDRPSNPAMSARKQQVHHCLNHIASTCCHDPASGKLPTPLPRCPAYLTNGLISSLQNAGQQRTSGFMTARLNLPQKMPRLSHEGAFDRASAAMPISHCGLLRCDQTALPTRPKPLSSGLQPKGGHLQASKPQSMMEHSAGK